MVAGVLVTPLWWVDCVHVLFGSGFDCCAFVLVCVCVSVRVCVCVRVCACVVFDCEISLQQMFIAKNSTHVESFQADLRRCQVCHGCSLKAVHVICHFLGTVQRVLQQAVCAFVPPDPAGIVVSYLVPDQDEATYEQPAKQRGSYFSTADAAASFDFEAASISFNAPMKGKSYGGGGASYSRYQGQLFSESFSFGARTDETEAERLSGTTSESVAAAASFSGGAIDSSIAPQSHEHQLASGTSLGFGSSADGLSTY